MIGNLKNMAKKNSDLQTVTKQEDSERLIAKLDFVICQNEYYREIRKGDDLTDVPERFHRNLKTEGII